MNRLLPCSTADAATQPERVIQQAADELRFGGRPPIWRVPVAAQNLCKR